MGWIVYKTHQRYEIPDLQKDYLIFASRYAELVRAAIGYPVIYYTPRVTPRGGTYIAFAIVRGVHSIPDNPKVMWADVEDYQPFSQKIALQEKGLFIESVFLGMNRRSAAIVDVRALPETEGAAILGSSERPYDPLPMQANHFGLATPGSHGYQEDTEDDVSNKGAVDGVVQYRVRSERVRALLRQIAIARYDGKCIFTSRRQSLGKGRFLAEAAHIFPLSLGGPDCIENTALMCPAMHELYDRGLIALSDNYRILTQDCLSEGYRRALNEDGHAALPQDECLWPNIELVRAHRREVFGASS